MLLIGSLKSTNSVGNENTAKSQQKERNNMLADNRDSFTWASNIGQHQWTLQVVADHKFSTVRFPDS